MGKKQRGWPPEDQPLATTLPNLPESHGRFRRGSPFASLQLNLRFAGLRKFFGLREKYDTGLSGVQGIFQNFHTLLRVFAEMRAIQCWHVLFFSSFEFPRFIEEACSGDLAGSDGVRGFAEIDDGPIWELRHLTCIVEVVVFPIREAAIDDDVAFRVEGIGIDEDRHVSIGVVFLAADFDAFGCPLDGQLVRDLLQDGIAARVAPENDILGCDVFVLEFGVLFLRRFTAELLLPLAPVGVTKTNASQKASSMGPWRP